jgi:hypothetical protein
MCRISVLRVLCAALALSLAGCGAGEEGAFPDEPEAQAVDGVKSVVASCQSTGFMVDRCWPDGSNLTITATEAFRPALIAAVAQWNALLEPAAALNAPRFSVSQGTTGDVVVEVFGTTAPYCDRVDLSTVPARLLMFSSNLPDCVAANTGDFTSVLKHGLGHVLGWTNVVHKQGVPGVSDNCIMYLSEDRSRPVGGDVCLHDVEAVFLAYRRLPLPAAYFPSAIAQ